MRLPGILLATTLVFCTTAALAARDVRQITVLQRVWEVTQIQIAPVTYKAVRLPMPDNFLFFGPPAELKTVQAIRAIEGATGCQVLRGTMYQNISAEFFTQVVCPAAPLAAQK